MTTFESAPTKLGVSSSRKKVRQRKQLTVLAIRSPQPRDFPASVDTPWLALARNTLHYPIPLKPQTGDTLMSWIESFSLVMRSSITSLRDKIEDPERLLNQMIIDMDEELIHVRESVAAAIADEILLRNKSRAAVDEAAQWDERAASALARGDESGARAALEQKILAEQRAGDLSKEHEKQRTETARLHDAVHDLEDKIRQARQKRTLLLARLVRADSTQRINAALERTESASAFAQFSRLEQRVERAEAMSEAWDRMDGRDPDARELERKFAEDERKQKVEQQLEALKSRVQEEK